MSHFRLEAEIQYSRTRPPDAGCGVPKLRPSTRSLAAFPLALRIGPACPMSMCCIAADAVLGKAAPAAVTAAAAPRKWRRSTGLVVGSERPTARIADRNPAFSALFQA